MDCRGNGWTSYTMLHSYILYKAKKSISLLKRLILAPWMIVYIIQGVFILEFLTYFHNFTTTFLIFIECCGDVPQNINFFNYRGTFFKLTRSFSQHTVYVICDCTPLYTFSCFLGYIFSNPCLFYAT